MLRNFWRSCTFVTEAAEHTTCDEVRVEFVHAARYHAVVRSPDHDADAQRFKYRVNGVFAIWAVSRSWICRRLA